MTPPTRRIWLFPAPDGTLEVILLGSIGEIAWEFAAVLKSAEAWPGFVTVEPIAVGNTVLGMRCRIGHLATHLDPVAEGLTWLATEDRFIHRVEWCGTDSSHAGKIGMW